MGDKTPERKGLLWWIEHENTNEAWTMRNPWAVGAIVLTILIVLCIVGDRFLGAAPFGGQCDRECRLLRLLGRSSCL